MADAAKAYEAFGQKQADAIKHILEEVRQGKRDLESVLRELNGNIDGLYDYIDSKERPIFIPSILPSILAISKKIIVCS